LRREAWKLAVALSLTRIAILAHWASDVVAGFALGAAVERIARRWTGYPPHPAMKQKRRRRGTR